MSSKYEIKHNSKSNEVVPKGFNNLYYKEQNTVYMI